MLELEISVCVMFIKKKSIKLKILVSTPFSLIKNIFQNYLFSFMMWLDMMESQLIEQLLQ